jgi:hypothetical protein
VGVLASAGSRLPAGVGVALFTTGLAEQDANIMQKMVRTIIFFKATPSYH